MLDETFYMIFKHSNVISSFAPMRQVILAKNIRMSSVVVGLARDIMTLLWPFIIMENGKWSHPWTAKEGKKPLFTPWERKKEDVFARNLRQNKAIKPWWASSWSRGQKYFHFFLTQKKVLVGITQSRHPSKDFISAAFDDFWAWLINWNVTF